MVAGRVHLRLGQRRGAILGPRPSLLETSILPRPDAHLRYLPSTMGGSGVPSLVAGRPAGRPVIHAMQLCCAGSLRQTRAHSVCTAP
jgi:hypothetical protein